MNNFLEIARTALDLFLAAGGLMALARFLKWSAASQKNQHIATALTFASQAVLKAQEVFGGGVAQQEAASQHLKQRLDDTGLGKYFTEEQLLAYIQEAYAKAKADGTLAEVKTVEGGK